MTNLIDLIKSIDCNNCQDLLRIKKELLDKLENKEEPKTENIIIDKNTDNQDELYNFQKEFDDLNLEKGILSEHILPSEIEDPIFLDLLKKAKLDEKNKNTF